MKVFKVFGTQISLLGAKIIEIEIDIVKNTLPSFTIIGLADKSIEESKERISAAIKNSGFGSIRVNQKITVSLSPADLKKEGSAFDLPIAINYLLSINKISCSMDKKIFIGELGLDGKIRKVRGILAMLIEAQKNNFTEIYLPIKNLNEASLISDIRIFGVNNLTEIVLHLKGEKLLKEYIASEKNETEEQNNSIDFSEIKGQAIAKRALEIAASGGHNVSLYGPPGVGKSMLSKAFCSILPKLNKKELLEVNSIYSISGQINKEILIYPPFRSPHHTSSYAAVIGGGTNPKPGEITLAHRGVLFLDEFPEFDKRVIESLREPIEEGFVNISRAKYSAKFPSNFILIIAFNPPKYVSEYYNYSDERKFRKKISGPIIDRIDIWSSLNKINSEILTTKKEIEKSCNIKERILQARAKQKNRYNSETKLNAHLSSKEIEKILNIDPEAEKILKESSNNLNLSARAFYKIIKVAQTISDLENIEKNLIKKHHILEALQYRPQKDLFD